MAQMSGGGCCTPNCFGRKKVEALLQPQLDRILELEKALKRIADGTHDENPTCMSLPTGEFGPPRTNGWEGWAREIAQVHREIARAALEGRPCVF